MPPRYAYWTIIVDDQPTAFRAGSQEDLMPTFKRLKAEEPSAEMMWFQNGKLWDSRLDAQEAMRAAKWAAAVTSDKAVTAIGPDAPVGRAKPFAPAERQSSEGREGRRRPRPERPRRPEWGW